MTVYSFIESGLGDIIALRVSGGWKLYEHECVDPVMLVLGVGFRYLTTVLSLDRGVEYLFDELGTWGEWIELDKHLKRRFSGFVSE